MAETIGSLHLTLDPQSLILSHFSDPLNPANTLQLITDQSFMERGPRYDAYAQLRESKLSSKRLNLYEDEQVPASPVLEVSPVSKKSVRFQGCFDQGSGELEEIEHVSEMPRSEISPVLKESVKGQRSGDNFEENVGVCDMPKPEISPILRKSVRFQRSGATFEENLQVSEIPKSEISPVLRKSVRFQKSGAKFEENVQVSEIPRSGFSPLIKKSSLRFQGNAGKKQGYSALAQSVPDFSSVIRKENRKPALDNGTNVSRIPRVEKSATPPPSLSKREKMYGSVSKYGGGSRSVNTGEKQRMVFGRKSYASIEELKGLSIAAASAINGEINKGGKKNNVLRKSTVFSSRYY